MTMNWFWWFLKKNNQAFCRTTAENLVAVTEVGVITGGEGVWLVYEQGATIKTEALGYKHAF